MLHCEEEEERCAFLNIKTQAAKKHPTISDEHDSTSPWQRSSSRQVAVRGAEGKQALDREEGSRGGGRRELWVLQTKKFS